MNSNEFLYCLRPSSPLRNQPKLIYHFYDGNLRCLGTGENLNSKFSALYIRMTIAADLLN